MIQFPPQIKSNANYYITEIFLKVALNVHSQGRLNSIIGPRTKQCTGAHTNTNTHVHE